MKLLRLILLLTLMALPLIGRADAGCGQGGAMMGDTCGSRGGWASQGPVFGRCGPPACGESQATRHVIDLLNNYLSTQPNLKAGQLTVKGNYWEAEILDRQGHLINKVLIDPRKGYFYYQK